MVLFSFSCSVLQVHDLQLCMITSHLHVPQKPRLRSYTVYLLSVVFLLPHFQVPPPLCSFVVVKFYAFYTFYNSFATCKRTDTTFLCSSAMVTRLNLFVAMLPIFKLSFCQLSHLGLLLSAPVATFACHYLPHSSSNL